MKMCDSHWEKLKQAIRDRGLWQFVANSGQEVAQRMAEGGFEPLMGAHNLIVFNTVQMIGILALGEGCPLCTATSIHKSECNKPGCTVVDYDFYIDKGADEMVTQAKGLGLIATA